MSEIDAINQSARVVRVNEILPHTNADSLGIVQLDGYQCVVKLGEFQVGDLAVFIQPDSVVPEAQVFAFLWGDQEPTAKRRRVTVRRFRKEWSEGLLLPLKEFPELAAPSYDVPGGNDLVGKDVTERLGITHYEPPEPGDPAENERGPGRQYKTFPRSFKGFIIWILRFFGYDYNGKLGGTWEKGPDTTPPIYDVANGKHFKKAFEIGEPVVVTEKIHGCNARFTFENGKMYAGSRRLWKKESSKCVWRRLLEGRGAWIEAWCEAHPGYTLYGEIVPVQDGYDYGMSNDDLDIYIFDIRTPEGKWLGYDEGVLRYVAIDARPIEVKDMRDMWAPILYEGPYDPDVIAKLVDGPSVAHAPLGKPGKHIREGIVVRPETERRVPGLGRLQLKYTSNEFLAATQDKSQKVRKRYGPEDERVI